MEYMQPFSPQFEQQPHEENQSSGGHSLRRSRSIELRAGKLYPTCDCIKRNGLQSDCRRTECQGKSCCMRKSGPTCSPASFAQRLANHNMGRAKRSGVTREVKVQRLGETKREDTNQNEIPLTNSPNVQEFEIKDLDPKMMNQFFPNGYPQGSFPQYNGTPMMGSMQGFDQGYGGFPMGQPIAPGQILNSQPQVTSSMPVGQSNTMEATSNSPSIMNSPPTASGLPQQFGKMPAPIAAFEPMPSIQQLPVTGFPTMPSGQQFGIPGQSFTPYNGAMNSYNPYSPNLQSYLPCGVGGMPSAIPCGTAQ
ncbi:uncharacterized protein LOC119659358 [Hermetia illucens]|uniref:uncharacterized protein LOC119659358 n=1 Tax=Hermetia illucens TaxID=343691 RepID=UPI0018CC74ED|nr:uncharacterized protein LOC119659358 [Hermetia illucens]